MDRLKARAKHRDWLNEIEARIANIRAERKGEGRTLTPQGARALAGEWYKWFVAQMAANKWPGSVWRDYRDRAWTDCTARQIRLAGRSMTLTWTMCGRSSPMKPRRHNSLPPSGCPTRSAVA